MEFTPAAVRKWMIANAGNHYDNRTGEYNATSLAEEAAAVFDQDYLDGPLDDETHWIWEEAARF